MNLTYSHIVVICVMQFVSLVALAVTYYVDIYLHQWCLALISLVWQPVLLNHRHVLHLYVYINVMAVFGYIHVTILILTKLVQCSVDYFAVWPIRHTRDIALLTSYLPGCTRAANAPRSSGLYSMSVRDDTSCCREWSQHSHCSGKKSFPFRSFWKMNGFWAIVLFIGYTAASSTPSKLGINVLNILLSRGPPYLQCKCV